MRIDRARARAAIDAELRSGRAGRGPLSLLSLVVTGLDAVERELGAEGVEQAMSEVAARAEGAVRRGDLVCRTGVGELVVVCPDADQGAVSAVTARIDRAVARPLGVGDGLVLGAEVGLAVADEGATADSLLDELGPVAGGPDGLARPGLVARDVLVERVESELAGMDPTVGVVAVVKLEVDDLARVAAALGRDAHDELLADRARALVHAAHEGDTVGRTTGDRLVVCCPHPVDADAARIEAEGFRTAVGGQLSVRGARLEVRASAGVAVAASTSDTALALVDRAGTALAQAVDAGRDRTAVFDDALREELLRQAELDAVVRDAVRQGAVPLAYQPLVRLKDEVVVGGEALLRLVDRRGEPVAASDAVRAAERTGEIYELGRLVLQEACERGARWQQAMPEQPFVLSVNISERQFADPDLAALVGRELDGAGLVPSHLVLEVSESALMVDPVGAARQLSLLKMQGVRIVVDDFGSGHSSLAHLKRFPVDGIKLDRAFIAGLPASLEDHAIVHAMVSVAQALGIEAVAVGVEDEQQLAELRRLGCRFGQGHLWSRAVRGSAIPALVTSSLAALDSAIVADAGARPAGPAPPAAITQDELEEVPVGGETLDSVFRVLVHEIRTPLTVVMGYASLLEGATDPDDADAAVRIRRASERIDRLIRNLADVSNVDAGSLRLSIRQVDLVAMVERVLDDLRDTLGRPLVLGPVADEVPAVGIDEARIEQTLINLVTNAAKFTPPGHSVEVQVARTGRWIDISVLDDGPGISIEDLGLVFRKYGRADRSVPGTGLGLYLARGIARAHGGDVLCRRRHADHGSVFTIRLPSPS
ncbi:EAL domain-containing protein [Iamia majanohamensis]|uniref:histidine kinase n=1 Tax=Iamia majanohamensis TaxID=467976 RepID=A0AAE9Y5S3_9ACTN|nr:EAL domain-containing protein [Iamia majanohamensis]WCO66016.1 EAL domain-containing protein [Iamia majanohamensis]